MSRRGNFHDKAMGESCFNLLKRKRIRRRTYKPRAGGSAECVRLHRVALQSETQAREKRDAVARRVRTSTGNENRRRLKNSVLFKNSLPFMPQSIITSISTDISTGAKCSRKSARPPWSSGVSWWPEDATVSYFVGQFRVKLTAPLPRLITQRGHGGECGNWRRNIVVSTPSTETREHILDVLAPASAGDFLCATTTSNEENKITTLC